MQAHEEGVVVKKMDSLYRIGVRSMANGCFKVKMLNVLCLKLTKPDLVWSDEGNFLGIFK